MIFLLSRPRPPSFIARKTASKLVEAQGSLGRHSRASRGHGGDYLRYARVMIAVSLWKDDERRKISIDLALMDELMYGT